MSDIPPFEHDPTLEEFFDGTEDAIETVTRTTNIITEFLDKGGIMAAYTILTVSEDDFIDASKKDEFAELFRRVTWESKIEIDKGMFCFSPCNIRNNFHVHFLESSDISYPYLSRDYFQKFQKKNQELYAKIKAEITIKRKGIDVHRDVNRKVKEIHKSWISQGGILDTVEISDEGLSYLYEAYTIMLGYEEVTSNKMLLE